MKNFYYIYCEPKASDHGVPHYRPERFFFEADAQELIDDLANEIGFYWRMTAQEHSTPPRGWSVPMEWT